jgi:hypothetical protein
MKSLASPRMLLVLRGYRREVSRACAMLQQRNKYTLDRPSTSTTMTAPSSTFTMAEQTSTIASATSYTGGSSSTYILDQPVLSSTYTLDRARHTYELESSPSTSFSSSTTGAPYREPWLTIAAGGILSFAGLMWLGEMEAAAKKAEIRMANASTGTPVTDPHVTMVVANHKHKNNKDDPHHRAARTKAEWFRPF